MAKYSKCQRFTANVATSTTFVGAIAGTLGARAIVLHVYGGSNAANALAAISAVASVNGAAPALGPVALSAKGTLSLTNGTKAVPAVYRLVDDNGATEGVNHRMGTPFYRLSLTMATALSNGVIVDAYVEYDDEPADPTGEMPGNA